MGVIIEHVDFIAYTGSGAIQRITLPSNFDATPKLFRVVMSGATSTDALVSESRRSEGWYDGTTSWVVGCRVGDTPNPSDTDVYGTTSADTVGVIIDETSQALDDYCQFDAWGTDGGVGYVDLEWNAGASSSSAAYRCRLTAYTGSDFSAKIGVEEVQAGGSGIQAVDTEYAISGLGFHPAAIRTFGAFGLTISTGNNYFNILTTSGGWGISDQDATPAFQQFAYGTASESGATSPSQGQTMFNSEESGGTARFLARGDIAGTSGGNMEWELTDTASGQFSYTIRNTVQNMHVGWVAMDFGGVIPLAIGYYVQRGSSDVSGYDGFFEINATAVDGSGTFLPQAVDWVASDVATTGYLSGNLTGSVNPYCATSANHYLSGVSGSITTGSTLSWAHRNSNPNRTARNWYSADFISVRVHSTGALRWDAAVSLESYGVQLDINTIPANTTKVNSFIAFGVPTTPAPGWRAAHVRRQTNQLRRM